MSDIHPKEMPEKQAVRIAIDDKLHARVKHYCKKIANPKMKLQDFYLQAAHHFLSISVERELELIDECIDQLQEMRRQVQNYKTTDKTTDKTNGREQKS